MIMDTYLSVRTLSEEERRVPLMLTFSGKIGKYQIVITILGSWISASIGISFVVLKTEGQRQDFLNTFKYAFIFRHPGV